MTKRKPRESETDEAAEPREAEAAATEEQTPQAEGAEDAEGAEEEAPREQAAEEEDELPPDAIPVLAARGMVLFPRVVLPILVGRHRSVLAVQAAIRNERPIGVLLQKDPEDEAPGPDGMFEVGTTAQVVRYVTAPDGSHHLIAQGESRFRIAEFLRTEPFLVARIEAVPEPEPDPLPRELEARLLSLKQQAHEVLELLPQKPEDLDNAVENATSPSMLTDLIATFMDVPVEERQEVLEAFDLERRMALVGDKLARVAEVLRLSREIRERTQGRMEKSQREYFLREQLRSIQKELGEESVELKDLTEAIDKAKMPAEVKKGARRELARLERMPEASAEYGMIRNYLETLTELPWAKSTKDVIDVPRARAILDEDHYGLEKIKRRILEFLAVRKLKPDGKGPILCFVGPPGVGKTSLGRSIARAMGRKFVRMSLGGVHDESEIRGHRRTYVGAMPGSVIQNLKKTGTNNPVFMLDEIDKLGRSLHGDPSSALLEVLDPEQNREFVDHYLNVPFDLSRVLFIATANVLDAIPGPLRDRCEIIELSGYTEEEKLQIAKRYLVGRQREENGLAEEQLELTDDALRLVVRAYTREAGVRNLEREIGALCRHAATRIASDEAERVRVDATDVPEVLGPPRFENEVAERTSVPGVATGLAWTPVGGEILFVEATRLPGKGELILTGQLGDVMRESVRAALSLVKGRLDELGVDEDVLSAHDVHVHVPAGAIPKDGPSAGVAMYVALASLLTGKTVANDVAMTGEISLRGLVLPVGGIKEKVLAAQAANVKTVLLPARNKKDFEDVPTSAREALTFVWLHDVRQAVAAALGIDTGAERPERTEAASQDGRDGDRERERLSARDAG